ncbi:MAG: hypothetical protein RL030_1730 [Pseudomonadota bacterium]|jgi:hypothetical protein
MSAALRRLIDRWRRRAVTWWQPSERDSLTAWCLLALGLLTHYGYYGFPEEIAPHVWNIAGSLSRLCFLAYVLWHRHSIAIAVGAWWAAEEALVIGCSVAWLVAPWDTAGRDQCTSLLGYDLGRLGALAVAVLLALLLKRRRHR